MPVVTRFTRNDKPIELRWGWWHLTCFLTAWEKEVPNSQKGGETSYTFTKRHRFIDTDGEVLVIMPGDTFEWWRD